MLCWRDVRGLPCARAGRTGTGTSRGLHVAVWGGMDASHDQLSMKLGLPADSLKLLGIQGLPSSYVLPLEVRAARGGGHAQLLSPTAYCCGQAHSSFCATAPAHWQLSLPAPGCQPALTPCRRCQAGSAAPTWT